MSYSAAAVDLPASTHCRECREWRMPSLGGLLTTGQAICQPCLERKVLRGGSKALTLDGASERVLL